jgi:hypothetical protein
VSRIFLTVLGCCPSVIAEANTADIEALQKEMLKINTYKTNKLFIGM